VFELPMRAVLEAFRCAKEQGLLTILNAAPAAEAPAQLPALVDVLVVNETEAVLLTPAPEPSPAIHRDQGNGDVGNGDPETTLQALRASGFTTAILTLGAKGAMWIDEDGIHRQAAFVVDVVDTTGAGDTFVGYLASGLATGQPLNQAVRNACAAGALAVTRPGAQGAIPRRAQVRRLSA
jgi:ribokinase